MQQKQYRRIADREREEISRGLVNKETMASIAVRLNRPTSAVSREVERNGGIEKYRAFSAHRRARRRAGGRVRGKSLIVKNGRLRTFVIAHIRERWSPEEISANIKEEYPHDMTMRISHEAIYRYIYVLPRGALKQELIRALRQERKYRRKQGGRKGKPEEMRGKIAYMLSIEERPKEVESRTIPGHWEGDLIMGKYKRTALGTLVERTTRKTFLVPLTAKDAGSVRKAYAKTLRALPKELAKTLTYDQGKEMSGHTQFTIDTGITVYFAHPGSPWERGTNENTNGLIRQYFPKGTEFDKVSVREIKRVERELNGRPRKVLCWKKPDEVFNNLVALNV